MRALRLSVCSGSVWPRPDGDDATPTRRALLARMEGVGTGPIGTAACALRRPSTPQESSSSLECQKAARGRRFLSPFLRRLDVPAFGPDDGEESMGEEREGDVAVPAAPATDLVVGEAHFPLRLLEADLHPPSAAGRPRQSPERRPLGSEDRICGEVFWILYGAAHQKPPLETLLKRRIERQPQPVVEAGAFRALSGRDTLPAFLG